MQVCVSEMLRFLAPVKIQDAGMQFLPGAPALRRLMKEAQEFKASLSLVGLQSQEKSNKTGWQIGFW